MSSITKGKVFIAWSGNTNLAGICRRNLIEHQYECIVGGESGKAGNLFVGATILQEIEKCNQAIFIVQKKQTDEISGNLLFELGYALSLFDAKKIHVFFVDIEKGAKTIPSDLDGIWANYITYRSEAETAQEIAEHFLKNQKYIIQEDKMTIVDSRYELKGRLCSYPKLSHCSEYEFAQYVLFYSQSAYLFGCEKEGINDITNLIHRMPEGHSEELDCAMLLAKKYLEFFKCITSGNNKLYIERSKFRQLRQSFEGYVRRASAWEENDFTCWLLAICYDVLNYMYWLHSESPELDSKTKELVVHKSLEYGQEYFKYSEKLKQNEQKHQNVSFLRLYDAYIYRNMAMAYDYLHSVYHDEISEKEKRDCLQKSLQQREQLFRYYQEHSINTVLLDNFEMEYYLALSESLPYEEDELTKEDMISDCQEYIDKVHKLHEERNFFISKIEKSIVSDLY